MGGGLVLMLCCCFVFNFVAVVDLFLFYCCGLHASSTISTRFAGEGSVVAEAVAGGVGSTTTGTANDCEVGELRASTSCKVVVEVRATVVVF